MTRYRHRTNRVEQQATDAADAPGFDKFLRELIETLSPERAELVQRLKSGMSLRQIADTQPNMTYERAQRQFYAVQSQLRHPSRAMLLDRVLRDLTDDEIHGITRHLERIALRDADAAPLSWCKYHGWTEPLGFPQCGGCPCEVPPEIFGDLAPLGRPRKYCSNACRQRAYRRRVGSQQPPDSA
ncbi:hypothetical protein [Nocardia sp. NPDC024068]|uniref:hypothetical protein n=1 Tax=Nocardia sp. NPDC024068 TaxID=3157197 RepID=UPI0034061441